MKALKINDIIVFTASASCLTVECLNKFLYFDPIHNVTIKTRIENGVYIHRFDTKDGYVKIIYVNYLLYI